MGTPMNPNDETGRLALSGTQTLEVHATGITGHIMVLYTLRQPLVQGFDVPPVELARRVGKIPVPYTGDAMYKYRCRRVSP
jgi:hypothetical protein